MTMTVTGKAEVHGIEGVEITAEEAFDDPNEEPVRRIFVVQLTDTHCRYLALKENVSGVNRYFTFLDEDSFLPNWGFGQDNCGRETLLREKGQIIRRENEIQSVEKPFLVDLVGRYTVKIAGKSYDTVCAMTIDEPRAGNIIEQYLDRDGRTVLWRRFNRNDFAFRRYQKKWSEMLPENERLTVNGETYVHCYDSISDYIL